jgi:hypothetical protein
VSKGYYGEPQERDIAIKCAILRSRDLTAAEFHAMQMELAWLIDELWRRNRDQKAAIEVMQEERKAWARAVRQEKLDF